MDLFRHRVAAEQYFRGNNWYNNNIDSVCAVESGVQSPTTYHPASHLKPARLTKHCTLQIIERCQLPTKYVYSDTQNGALAPFSYSRPIHG
jgi:hypothetical protein